MWHTNTQTPRLPLHCCLQAGRGALDLIRMWHTNSQTPRSPLHCCLQAGRGALDLIRMWHSSTQTPRLPLHCCLQAGRGALDLIRMWHTNTQNFTLAFAFLHAGRTRCTRFSFARLCIFARRQDEVHLITTTWSVP